jgi:hypothetical protein
MNTGYPNVHKSYKDIISTFHPALKDKIYGYFFPLRLPKGVKPFVHDPEWGKVIYFGYFKAPPAPGRYFAYAEILKWGDGLFCDKVCNYRYRTNSNKFDV